MKAEEIYDCIYTRPYAENDALLNDYVDEILRRVSLRLFERQEDICFMVSERNPPMLKDGAVDIIEAECHKELNWLVDYIVNRMLISYRLNNIDLGEEGESELRWNLGDEEYEDFEKIELRTGKVISCEPVPKSKKLLCFQIQSGSEKRQIISGIRKYYEPEELVGKTVNKRK